jgi:hypothetical protein
VDALAATTFQWIWRSFVTLGEFEELGERFAGLVCVAAAGYAIFQGEWPRVTAFTLGAILFELCAIKRALSAGEKP